MNEICLSCKKHTKCGRAKVETIGCGYYVPMTNEQWFCGMYTEAKAEWLADHMKCSKCPQHHRCNGHHGGCVALMVEWLKEKHQ